MRNGLKKVRPDKRDYDFLKSHKHLFGAASPSAAGLPDEFLVDAGLTMPDQEAENDQYNPPIPALPFGCTDYTQTDLCIDEDGVLYNPQLMEDYTHANARGGYDIRKSLDATRKIFARTAYFNIRPSGMIDAFDAIRLAMYSALPEKRAVSIGIPWFAEFEDVSALGMLPMPQNFVTAGVPWHNAKVAGWKAINGVPYLVLKSWQGPQFGDHGWVYMSRALANVLMSFSGTGAFTLSKVAPHQIMTVDLTVVERIVSFVLNLLASLSKPMHNDSTIPDAQNAPQLIAPPVTTTLPTPLPPVAPAPAPVPVAGLVWNTVDAARHSLRVICDEEGLSVTDKNELCATVAEESGFMSYYLSGPKKGMPVRRENFLKNGSLWSTDWGICQWNDHYHGKEITPREALDNPEKAVRLMCAYWKMGEAGKRQWVAYKNGGYKKHL